MTSRIALCSLLLAVRLLGTDLYPTRIEAPVYPPLANQARIEGTVKLKLGLSARGEVLTADIISGNRVLAKAAQANALKWGFAAPCSNGETAGKAIEITYDFRLVGEVQSRPTTLFRYEHPYRISIVSQALHWTP